MNSGGLDDARGAFSITFIAFGAKGDTRVNESLSDAFFNSLANPPPLARACITFIGFGLCRQSSRRRQVCRAVKLEAEDAIAALWTLSERAAG